MAYKDKEKEKAYRKAYYLANKDKIKSRSKKQYQIHKDEIKSKRKDFRKTHIEEIKFKQDEYYQIHKDEIKAKHKVRYASHREEHNARCKAWYQSNKEYFKEYIRNDTNSLGISKDCIRKRSRYYLYQTLNHPKIEGYEIHHCFGYEDYKKFIYIPKELHLQIHQFLRDNCIDSDTDHYNQIAQLIINYIKCNEKHILILKQSQ